MDSNEMQYQMHYNELEINKVNRNSLPGHKCTLQGFDSELAPAQFLPP